MRKYLFTPDFHNGQGKISFVCSLSPMLRLAATNVPELKETLHRHIKSVVEEVVSKKEVANSLKVPIGPGVDQMRQVDIRADNNGQAGDIVLKCFISWDSDKDWWLACVEGANETYWEDRRRAIGRG